MKDPAFPFYAQDFLVGTLHLSCQETGAYIKLLAYQWVNLGIPKNRIGSVLGNGWESIWPNISDKFTEKDGLLFNQRLETEREKRAAFKQKQSDNGKKGGRPKKDETTVNDADTSKKTKNNKAVNPTKTPKKPLENESKDENENIIEFEKGKEGMGEKPDVVQLRTVGEALVMPFDTPEFAAQWQVWKEYRATEHHFAYRSIQGEQAALAELGNLSKFTQASAIAILHQSMGKGWKGFFELKNDGAKPTAAKGKVRYSDDFKRKIAQRLQSG